MKAGFLRTIFVAVLLSMACSGTWAQNKTQAYYNSHEREILPDARTAFRSGDYARTAELCRWHYIIVGDRAADALRDQAERCGQYASRMAALKDEGKNSEAKAAAQALLAINPDDLAARKLVEEIEALEKVEHERELERQRELEKQQELERQRELEAQKVSEETTAVEKPVEESVKDALDIGSVVRILPGEKNGGVIFPDDVLLVPGENKLGKGGRCQRDCQQQDKQQAEQFFSLFHKDTSVRYMIATTV